MEQITSNQRLLQIAFFAVGLALTGCASNEQLALDTKAVKQERLMQEQITLEEVHRQNSRLQRLSFPLLQTATNLCGNRVKPKLGIQLHTKDDYPIKRLEAVSNTFGPLTGIRIKDVTAGGPAQDKLLAGDRLVQIKGETVADSSHGAAKQLRKAMGNDLTVVIQIDRDGDEITVTLEAVKLCDYPVILSRRDAINAFADGESIIINEGLMRFATADEELALIIAHELAHNVIDHRADKIRDGLIGGLFDIAISLAGNVISPGIGVGLGANLLSQKYEVEADVLAIQLMHQLGYPIESLPAFWRKMASVHPSSIHHGQQVSHPTTVERYLIMKQEVERLTQLAPDTDKAK